MKLTDIAGLPGKAIPTGIEGLYCRNVPLDQLRKLEAYMQDDPEGGVAKFIHALVVDENCERPEDLQSADDAAVLPVATQRTITEALTEALAGGKPQPTSG